MQKQIIASKTDITGKTTIYTYDKMNRMKMYLLQMVQIPMNMTLMGTEEN